MWCGLATILGGSFDRGRLVFSRAGMPKFSGESAISGLETPARGRCLPRRQALKGQGVLAMVPLAVFAGLALSRTDPVRGGPVTRVLESDVRHKLFNPNAIYRCP